MSELAFNRVILEKNNQTLAILSTASLGLNLILAFLVLFSIQKPALIVYEDNDHISALALRQYKIQEDGIKSFTNIIVSQYLNFNAASLPKQVDGISPYLAPKPLAAIMDSYKLNQSKMEKENIAQEFIISETRITKKNSPYWVEVEGIRIISADENKKRDKVTYIFEIEKIKPTIADPYGLRVLDVVEKKASTEEKKK